MLFDLRGIKVSALWHLLSFYIWKYELGMSQQSSLESDTYSPHPPSHPLPGFTGLYGCHTHCESQEKIKHGFVCLQKEGRAEGWWWKGGRV